MSATELSKRMIACFPTDPIEKHLLFHLLYLLANGSPLSLDHVSRQLAYSTEKLNELLKKLPGVELDSSGSIISVAGLSLHETAYPMDGGKSRIYAQSGFDAIVVPTLLLRKLGIEYHCPENSVSLHLRFCFDQAFALHPEETVISFPSPTNLSTHLRNNRAEFRFFPNPDAARRWLWQNPEGVILSVKNVFEAAVALRRSLMDSSFPTFTP